MTNIPEPSSDQPEPPPPGQPELFKQPEKRKSKDKFVDIYGVRCRFARIWPDAKFYDVHLDDPRFPAGKIVHCADNFDQAKQNAYWRVGSFLRQISEQASPPGQPGQADMAKERALKQLFTPPAPPWATPPAPPKEKRTSAKRRNPLINRSPPSPEEMEARSAAAEAKYNAIPAEEREAQAQARAAQQEAARVAARAVQGAKWKERLAKIRADLLSGASDDPEMLRLWLTPEERAQAHKVRMTREKNVRLARPEPTLPAPGEADDPDD
jgi:hypothetical protein